MAWNVASRYKPLQIPVYTLGETVATFEGAEGLGRTEKSLSKTTKLPKQIPALTMSLGGAQQRGFSTHLFSMT